MSKDPWRQRCPKGHTVKQKEHSYYCASCECSYYGDPYDAKTTEFPVDEQPLYPKLKDKLLRLIYRETGGRKRTVVVARVFGKGQLANKILSRMRSDGLIAKSRTREHPPYAWRLTHKGLLELGVAEQRLSTKLEQADPDDVSAD